MNYDLLRTVMPLFVWSATALAVESQTEAPPLVEQTRTITFIAPVTINYLEALPDGYEADATQHWPLVIFLHGAGERGDDFRKTARYGPPQLVESGRTFPFILLSPQCPGRRWWDEGAIQELDTWLNHVLRKYRIDTDRIYLTGLSMGGQGTWLWAHHSPDRFAAIVPICGPADPKHGARLKNLPIWAFHGAKDRMVSVTQTEGMIAAIRKAGGQPRVTIYPEMDHDSWTATYANEDVFTWMLAQKRAGKKP